MADWEYSWKSSDGVRHEGVMAAASKDEVYTKLKEQGIRAIRVSERIVLKGGIRSLRKRDWTIIVAMLAFTAVGACYFSRKSPPVTQARSSAPRKTASRSGSVESDVIFVRRTRSQPRHQMANVPDASKIFAHSSEVFLAAFAVPGDAQNLPVLTDEIASDFFDAFDDEISLDPNDEKPVADLKRVVIGLKNEAESFLESGKSAQELARWLVSRQRMESSYRSQLQNDVKKGILSTADANSALREAGLRELE